MNRANSANAPQAQRLNLIGKHRQTPYRLADLGNQVQDGWGDGEGWLVAVISAHKRTTFNAYCYLHKAHLHRASLACRHPI